MLCTHLVCLGERTPSLGMKDLVILVADNSMRVMVEALLGRTESLGIRPVTADVFVHMHRDPGVLRESGEFLRPLAGQYSYALAMFDRHGCGRSDGAAALAQRVQEQLDLTGWVQRSRVVVLDPELETWVWSDSPHVASILGMSHTALEDLLVEQYGSRGHIKRTCPKEAMKEVLRRSRTPRSSSLYQEVAQRVGLRRCTDPAFASFKACLREWFPR